MAETALYAFAGLAHARLQLRSQPVKVAPFRFAFDIDWGST
jgi:hypothetical protein